MLSEDDLHMLGKQLWQDRGQRVLFCIHHKLNKHSIYLLMKICGFLKSDCNVFVPPYPIQLYLSSEQAKAMNGNNSQGPVYKSFGAIGPQPESRYSTAAATGFGTSARAMKDRKSYIPGPGRRCPELVHNV